MNGSEIWLLTISVGLLYLFYRVVLKTPENSAAPRQLGVAHIEPSPDRTSPALVSSEASSLQEIVSGLTEYYTASAHPEALLNHPKFQEGVELLNQGGSSSKDLIAHYHGSSAVAACMALEAY